MSDTNGTTATRKKSRRAKITIVGTVVTVAPQHPDGSPTGKTKSYDAAALPDEMQRLLMVNLGLKNKLMDSWADPTTDVLAEADETYANMMAGNWSVRGETGERTTLFLEAYAKVTKSTVDAVRARVNAVESGDDDAAKGKLAAARKHPQIVGLMATIAADKAAARARDIAAAQKGQKVDAIAAF